MAYKKHIGVYKCKLLSLRVIGIDGCGGRFNLVPDDFGGTEVLIGLDDSWPAVVGTFIHECNELYLTMRGYRYTKYPDIGTDTGGFIFTFNHEILSEVSNFTASAVANVYHDLFKEYKKRAKSLGIKL